MCRTQLTCVLQYMSELLHDHEEGIGETQIEIPTHVGSPCVTEEKLRLTDTSSSRRIQITTRVQVASPSCKVYSKSHAEDTVQLRSHNEGQAIIKYTSARFLEKPYVLLIKPATSHNTSRCFAERHHENPNSVAMHLTFIPQFLSEERTLHEYIFVVDRSGSMSGRPIHQAKDTLQLLLHAFPSEHTVFNIYSFGTIIESVFNASCPHSPESLQTAVKF